MRGDGDERSLTRPGPAWGAGRRTGAQPGRTRRGRRNLGHRARDDTAVSLSRTPMPLDWTPRRDQNMTTPMRMIRSPGGPLAEPTTNWDDAIWRLRLFAPRRSRFRPATARLESRDVDPAVLNRRRAVRRQFWGVTDCGHRRVHRGKGGRGQTPLTGLTPPGADVERRTIPVPEAFAEGQSHLQATRKGEKNRQRGRNGP
jgi:hypothetical protein